MMNQPPRRIVTRNGVKPGLPNRLADPRPTRPPMGRPGFPAGGKPAPAPAPAAARPGGFGRRPVPPTRVAKPTARPAASPAARDPLDALVDRIIGSRVSPIVDERQQAREQVAGNILQQERLGAAYNEKVKGLRESANLDLGSAVAQAAKLRGYSEDTIREYQDYARGLLAPTSGGSGDASVAASAGEVRDANRAAFDSMSAEIAARGRGLNDWLAKQELSGAALTGELVGQERQRLSAAEREFASRISQERAKRGELKYDLAQKEREFQLQKLAADRAFGLQQAGLEMDAAGLALDTEKLALAAREKNDKARVDPGVFGFGKDRDESIKLAIATWRQGLQPRTDKDGNVVTDSKTGKPLGPTVKQPWRELFTLLRDTAGLKPDQAALLAASTTRGTPYDLVNAKKKAWGVFTMLRNRGVSAKVQKFIITQYFGENAWKALSTGPAYSGPVKPSKPKPKPKPASGPWWQEALGSRPQNPIMPM